MKSDISKEFITTIEQMLKKSQGEKCTVEMIEPCGGGAHNVCYYIVTKNPANKFFLKCENTNIMPRTRCDQIEREIEGIKLMHKAGIPCTQVIQYDLSKQDIGTKYILEEFIEGKLIHEIWNELSINEKQNITNEIEDIIQKMRNINFTYYGDIFDNGIIGKHTTWREAYLSIGKVLIEDSRHLNIFTEDELALLSNVIGVCSSKLSTNIPASFDHRDLGKHNVIASTSNGITKISAIIDFGISLSVPYYSFDYGIRKYGDWNLEVVDILKKYAITKEEFDATELIFDFELTIFLASIQFAADKPYGYISRIKSFMETIKEMSF